MPNAENLDIKEAYRFDQGDHQVTGWDFKAAPTVRRLSGQVVLLTAGLPIPEDRHRPFFAGLPAAARPRTPRPCAIDAGKTGAIILR